MTTLLMTFVRHMNGKGRRGLLVLPCNLSSQNDGNVRIVQVEFEGRVLGKLIREEFDDTARTPTNVLKCDRAQRSDTHHFFASVLSDMGKYVVIVKNAYFRVRSGHGRKRRDLVVVQGATLAPPFPARVAAHVGSRRRRHFFLWYTHPDFFGPTANDGRKNSKHHSLPSLILLHLGDAILAMTQAGSQKKQPFRTKATPGECHTRRCVLHGRLIIVGPVAWHIISWHRVARGVCCNIRSQVMQALIHMHLHGDCRGQRHHLAQVHGPWR